MRIYLPLLLFIGLAWGQEEYFAKNLVQQSGVYKKKFSDEIANGMVFKMISGNKAKMGRMKNGNPDGIWNYWKKNGLKNMERIYNNGTLTQVTVYNGDGTE